ncbi:hypothetical protein LCGC14_2889890 [marine sediment metagenome]|uniref:Ribbon-helix-helix protein CopG domain-containing protein n=1 Tax=marine sediment metagenome TaxID=412755 RepID=A0A0F9A5E6_9ZZZZ
MPRVRSKPKPDDDDNLIQLQARITRELMTRIKQHADAEEISVSAYVRRTLKNHVPGG